MNPAAGRVRSNMVGNIDALWQNASRGGVPGDRRGPRRANLVRAGASFVGIAFAVLAATNQPSSWWKSFRT
jgi:hypothetical protein